MIQPPADVETAFIPELRQPIPELPPDATLAVLIERVNLLSALIDQSILDLIGDTGETIETRDP